MNVIATPAALAAEMDWRYRVSPAGHARPARRISQEVRALARRAASYGLGTGHAPAPTGSRTTPAGAADAR